MKRISVFGSGYVGLVTASCLAAIGHEVVCVDPNGERVRRLRAGEVPLHEPGLAEVMRAAHDERRLEFTSNPFEGVAHAEIIFIAVGTPSTSGGAADLRDVFSVANDIGRAMTTDKLVVNKSTVPVGTAEQVQRSISVELARRKVLHQAVVLSNPEFLKEGEAVRNFMEPDRIIIGCGDIEAFRLLCDVYSPLGVDSARIIMMSTREAEFSKYAANAMLAARISLMNEFANLAELQQVDIDVVRQGLGADPRIGNHFLYAGSGFGGSCFPKDVAALIHAGEAAGAEMKILKAVRNVNDLQKRRMFEKISRYFDDDLSGRVIAVWGLAFKPGTDDVREASSRVLMELLWEAGARVRAHDPAAMHSIHALYGDRDDLVLCDQPMEALQGSDVLALVTEWRQYRHPDFALLKRTLRYPQIFDGRNVLDIAAAEKVGVRVAGIGRASVPQAIAPSVTASTMQRGSRP